METEVESIPIIIIGGKKQITDYIALIYMICKNNNRIAIRYMDNYTPMIESLVYGLRKSFGWLKEDESKKIMGENLKCYHLDEGKCACDSGHIKCTFQIRTICEKYVQKDKSKFLINELIIEKHGAIRGL
jgi:hypothetical protein